MYGTTPGTVSQPLQNLVLNEVPRVDGLKEVYLVVSMKDLPSGHVFARQIADYAKEHPNIGQLVVTTNNGNELPFQGYLDDAESLSRGLCGARFLIPLIVGRDTIKHVLGLRAEKIASILGIAHNKSDTVNLFYAITLNGVVEHFLRFRDNVSPNPIDYSARPPEPVILSGISPEDQFYAVLGYRILAVDKEAEEFVKAAVKIGEDTKYLAVPVTLEQLTFMRQIIPLLEDAKKHVKQSAQEA